MDLTITSQPKEKYLLIESKGIIKNTEELVLQSQMVHAEIIKYNYDKILLNEPKTKLPLELSMYFDLVKIYGDSVKPEVQAIKLAIVISKKYIEVVSSWEAICKSRGLYFYVFTSFKKAEEYLLNGGDEEGWQLRD